MFSAGHEPKRGIDARSGKRPIRKWPQSALLDEHGNLLEHLAGQFFIAVEDRVHRHDVKRRIGPQRPERNARVLINVALADFDETAELGETREPHRDRLAGERIQDDVHALAIGQLHDRFGKIAAARVDDVLHAESLKERALARAAGRRDDFRAKMPGDLNRRHSDTARARVNENAFALA